MPGIDFDRLRREITMEEVLNLFGFEPVQRTGAQWYGRCPLHESSSERGLVGRTLSTRVLADIFFAPHLAFGLRHLRWSRGKRNKVL